MWYEKRMLTYGDSLESYINNLFADDYSTVLGTYCFIVLETVIQWGEGGMGELSYRYFQLSGKEK